jgi:orotidine-5'-phosphate decarboxylase
MKPELIVALDVDKLDEARRLVEILLPAVKYFKIGNQLFMACGPEAVRMVGERGGKVFFDQKFYDIPNTVENACYASTTTGSSLSFSVTVTHARDKSRDILPVFMMSVHARELEVLQGAVRGAKKRASELNISRPLIVGITVLTSENLGEKTYEVVLDRAQKAHDAGLDGVVCSVHETKALRDRFGENFILVNPGIRPANVNTNDQKRTGTPADAVKAGASYIVVGRPILEAADPLKAAQDILKEMVK